MKNSTLNRSMLSSENMALLAELKSQNSNDSTENTEINETLKSKQDELDILWQNFKISAREEKSPGIYILTGFIAGALSMFLMTAMLSITTFSNSNKQEQVKEHKIIKKEKGSFFIQQENVADENVETTDMTDDEVTAEELNTTDVVTDKYKVKPGDSLEAISVKFYGKASPENTRRIQEANELKSPHSIYAGQELLIPVN